MGIRRFGPTPSSWLLLLAACAGSPEPRPSAPPDACPSVDPARSLAQMEDLILPRAEFEDDGPADTAPGVVLDVLQSGSLQQDGRQLLDLSVASDAQIAELLRELRREGLAAGRLSLQPKEVDGQQLQVLAERLLIRAEKGTEWAWVQNLMKGCSREDVAFWQVSLMLRQSSQ